MNIPKLLRQIADHLETVAPENYLTLWPNQSPGQQQDFYPSAIPGQQIPVVTGNPSIDFTVAMLGGVPQPTPERDANLAAWAAEHDDKVYAGKYHAGGLDDAAAGFVYAYSMTQPGMALAGKLYWESGLIAGPRATIAQLIDRGERYRNGKGKGDQWFVDNYPDGQFKQDVLAVK
jgi:hypothetical protein